MPMKRERDRNRERNKVNCKYNVRVSEEVANRPKGFKGGSGDKRGREN